MVEKFILYQIKKFIKVKKRRKKRKKESRGRLISKFKVGSQRCVCPRRNPVWLDYRNRKKQIIERGSGAWLGSQHWIPGFSYIFFKLAPTLHPIMCSWVPFVRSEPSLRGRPGYTWVPSRGYTRLPRIGHSRHTGTPTTTLLVLDAATPSLPSLPLNPSAPDSFSLAAPLPSRAEPPLLLLESVNCLPIFLQLLSLYYFFSKSLWN